MVGFTRRRVGISIVSLGAGLWIPILLLSGCHSPAESLRSADRATVEQRVAALESRQKDLELQFQQLRRQFDDSTSTPARSRADIKPARPLPSGPIGIAGLAVVGAPTAALAIIEYSDFQCAYCRRYYLDTWPLIERDYVRTGQIRYVFHPLPLDRLHPYAVGAAEAGECAAQQGRFLEMRDRLFQSPQALGREALTQHASDLKLDMPGFAHCIATDAPSIVRSQQQGAAQLGILSTPTFFIGRFESRDQVRVLRRIAGAQPFSIFKDVLERLAKAPG